MIAELSQTDVPERHVLVLGATGSIGRQALEVLPSLPGVRVVGLSADTSADLLLEQAAALGVRDVCLRAPALAADLASRQPSLAVRSGDAGVRDLVSHAAGVAASAGVPLVVLNGIVGAAGLRATVATLQCGATLALANKESMVAGGPFVLDAARRSGARIIPVDSEHSAISQCLSVGVEGHTQQGAVEEILLTGSGGPFRGRKTADLADVTPAEALAHPTWAMGPKISVDSATLMNKGLEVIEAHRLFGVPYERITVVLNPQSIIHSMVRFADGALLAHLGVPDMRTPIAYALAYPARPALAMVRRLDLFAGQLTFERPDTETFRCLALARQAGQMAAAAEALPARQVLSDEAEAEPSSSVRTVAAPIVLNAANEVAVAGFLRGGVPFSAIPEIVERCLVWLGDEPVSSLDDVYACDAEARRFAHEAAGHPA
jgi:1-deoxy-D-xylulose-5-phosphate reductoisomerase